MLSGHIVKVNRLSLCIVFEIFVWDKERKDFAFVVVVVVVAVVVVVIVVTSSAFSGQL